MYIKGGVKPGAHNDQYEVYVMRTQLPGAEKARDWELLLAEIPDFEAAKQYREFLITRREFSEADVAIQQVTWVAVTIGVVG